MPGRLSAIHWGLALAASALLHWGAFEWWMGARERGSAAGGPRGVSELHLVLATGAENGGNSGDASEKAEAAGGVSREFEPVAALRERAPTDTQEQASLADAPPPPETPRTPATPVTSLAAAVEQPYSAPGGDSWPEEMVIEAPQGETSSRAVASGEEAGVRDPLLPAVSAGLPEGSAGSHAGTGSAEGSTTGLTLPGGGGAAVSYWEHIVARVEGALRYPRRALRSRVSGSALVAVRIDRAGQLLECEIARSSGSALLDRDARATVERAAPFGEVPESLAERDLAFEIPVAYDIARQ